MDENGAPGPGHRNILVVCLRNDLRCASLSLCHARRPLMHSSPWLSPTDYTITKYGINLICENIQRLRTSCPSTSLSKSFVMCSDDCNLMPPPSERQLELSGLPNYQRKGPEARTRLCNFWRTVIIPPLISKEKITQLTLTLLIFNRASLEHAS